MDNLTTEFFPKVQPRKIYSVSEVNRIAKITLENFSGLVHGEIAELEKIKTRVGYFLKFKLKDEVTEYTLPVICWPEVIEDLEFELKNGLAILIFGYLTLYEKTGYYQFQAQNLELFGEGLLAAKFEQLKKKLRSEGLFDEKYKKPIPTYPVKIGVITSETSAAWIDFKKHTVDRFPFFEIFLVDVFVQGEQAVSDIVWAIEKLNREDLEVIVITRGGGSLEDLAAFNSEEIARAIFSSKIPIISAIGHERDETIADWVADLRASTPTAAAKLITSHFEEFLVKSDQYASNLTSLAAKFYQTKLLEVTLLGKEFEDSVVNFIDKNARTIEDFAQRLLGVPETIFQNNRTTLENLTRELELLTPQRILVRGYSITYKLPEDKIIKDATSLAVSDKIKIRLAKGEIKARVFEQHL